MTALKKLGLVGGMAALLLSSVAIAGVGENIVWLDKYTFQVSPYQGTKPGKQWDTQKTNDTNSKYKFVLHRAGANPKCWLHFDVDPAGKTAHSYATRTLKRRYRDRGLTGISIRKEVIAGRNTSILTGHDPHKNHRYMVGAWRNREVGINLECDAHVNDFAVYEPQFRNFINSSRIISETSY